MKRLYLYIIMALITGLLSGQRTCCAQTPRNTGKEILHYIVEGKDTIYIDQITASKVYSRLPKQKGKDWRKYYRLVHNFSKTYPYALAARKIVARADSTIAADKLKRTKRQIHQPGPEGTVQRIRKAPQGTDRQPGSTSDEAYRQGNRKIVL